MVGMAIFRSSPLVILLVILLVKKLKNEIFENFEIFEGDF